jgi:chromosome segregation ATPase
MSFVGKMLIVLQVVLSVIFMAFAGAVYTAQTSWKQQHDSLQTQVQQLQTTDSDNQAAAARQVTDLTKQRDDSQQRAEAAEGKLAQLNTQFQNELAKNNRLELELKAQTGLADAKSNEASFRDEEAQRQRIAYQTLRTQLNEMAAELRTTEDELFAERLERQAISGRHDNLLAENADLKKILRLNDLSADSSAYASLAEPPPPVDGLVVATRKDKTNRTEFVEVSIGSDDGLSMNHEMDVFRAAASGGKTQYLGRIRIVYLTPDRAVGRVIETAKNGIIERGDNVTTKL